MRPNPNKLLDKINNLERIKKRGKLKIFLGYAAGVGKTYAMLDAAHSIMKTGTNVWVGYIEPHARVETLDLLNGLNIIPPLKVPYKGIKLNEFDLDATLKLKPDIVLVDELAHTNAEGLRHRKRYSDIEELLDAGIDVYTTLNVQHIESLNDIVASITNVVVNERIPDRVFNEAYQVELIDIDPEDLIARLNDGKIYKEKQAQKALKNFFTKKNLYALREIALRRTADRVNKDLEGSEYSDNKIYHTNEHILVCLSSSPSNAKVIRTAARMAEAFHASFTALFVQTTNSREMKDKNIGRLRSNLKLAEELGAEITSTYGDDVPHQIAEFCKVSGISKIVLGRSNNKKGIFKTKHTLIDKLISMASDLDIYVIPDNDNNKVKEKKYLNRLKFTTVDFVKMILIMLTCSIVSMYFSGLGFSEANIITILILGVLLVSNNTNGKIYGVTSSVLGVIIFNFFFTETKFTLNAYKSSYFITFAIMLISSLITSTLTTRAKSQANISAINAYRTHILLEVSRELHKANNLKDIIEKAQKQLNKLLKKPIIFYTVENEKIQDTYTYEGERELEEKCINKEEQAVVSWVIKNKKRAGVSTDTLPGSKALYIPLISQEDEVIAVVGIVINNEELLDGGEKSLYEAMLLQINFALEKYYLSEREREALMEKEQERVRANILRAISHDLRTPLTSISGSANSLMENKFDEETKNKLILDIYDDSMWLINLVENLLSVSKINNGNISLKMQPQLIDDIIAEALKHVNRKSKEYNIIKSIPDDIIIVEVDARLIVQVIINIVDNAIKYTEPGSTIEIKAKKMDDKALIEISDNGKGISEYNKGCVFDMFFTLDGNKGDSRRGLGLGLALCKTIINAHNGEIYVKDNKPKGTLFCFTLPLIEVKNNEQNLTC